MKGLAESLEVVKLKLIQFLNEIKVPKRFLYSFLLLFLFMAVIASTRYWAPFSHFLIKLDLPHNPFFDKLYWVFDPMMIFLVTGFYVFSKYLRVAIRNSSFRSGRKYAKPILKRIVLSVAVLVISLFVLRYLEQYYFKPFFKIARPLTRTEHTIINAILEDGFEEVAEVSRLNFNDFQCPVGRIISSIREVNPNKVRISKEEILKEAGIRGFDLGEIEQDLRSIIRGAGSCSYAQDISLPQKIEQWKKIKSTKADKLNLWLSDLIAPPSKKCETDSSCPSGFVMRQIFVWFFALLLFLQKGPVRDKVFASRNTARIFIGLNSFALIYVGISRVYGYRHTFYDEYMSLALAVLLAILLLFLYRYQQDMLLAKKSTELKSVYQELRRYLDEANDPLYTTNDSDIIIDCNDEFWMRFGFKSKEEALGKSILLLYVYPEKRKELKKDMRASGGRLQDYYVYAKRYGDTDPQDYFVITVDCHFHQDDERGIFEGVQGIVRPVSELIEKSVDPIYRADAEGIITYCNQAFAQMFGRTIYALMYKDIKELWKYPSDRDKFLKVLAEYGAVKDYIVRAKRFEWTREGDEQIETEMFVEVHSRLVDPEDPKRGVEGTLRQVTLVEVLFRHSFHGIYVIQEDTEGNYIFTFVNNRLKEIFGYGEMTLETFISTKRVKDIVAPRDWPIVERQIKLKLEKAAEDVKETYYFNGRTKNGRNIRAQVNSSHFASFRNKPAVVGYIRDMTAEEDEKVQIAYRHIGETAESIHHEIFNPMCSVKWDIEGMLSAYKENKEISKERKIQILERCIRAANISLTSTEFLRDFGEIGVMQLKPISLLRAVDKMKQRARKGIEVVTDIRDDYIVKGLSGGLVIIFSNLLRNSMESMPEGGVITVSAKRKGKFCVVSFSDTGTGIAEEIKNKLFRGKITTKPGKQRGKGLALVQSIVSSWDGDVLEPSTSPDGTTIRFQLPLYEGGENA